MSAAATFDLKLTAQEALELDGKCSATAQAVVELAKDTLSLTASDGLPGNEAAMVAKILGVAREKGRLTYYRTNISHCPCCERTDGYYAVKRNTAYKSKGQPDYSKPKMFNGYDLDRGFVVVGGSIFTGFCYACEARVMPVLSARLSTMAVALPDHWAGVQHDWKRYDKRHCKQCGWGGHEGEMKPGRTLMGDGTYPCGCPNCDAKNLPFGRDIIETIPGFVVVPTPERDDAAGRR